MHKKPKDSWNFLSRDSKFPIPQNNKGKDSEFVIPKEHIEGFRNSDPPKNTTKGSEFDPQRAQGRIQHFWPTTMTHKMIQNFWYSDTQKDAEFLISYKDTEKYSEFLIP